MAKRKKATTVEGYPLSVLHQGTFCNYQMRCPITNDLIYTGQKANGENVSVLLINPDAAEHQRKYLAQAHR